MIDGVLLVVRLDAGAYVVVSQLSGAHDGLAAVDGGVLEALAGGVRRSHAAGISCFCAASTASWAHLDNRIIVELLTTKYL